MDKRTYANGLVRPDRDHALAIMQSLQSRTDLHQDKDFMSLFTIAAAAINELITLDDRLTALEGAVEANAERKPGET